MASWLPGLVWAQDSSRWTTNYYPITGTSLPEIRRSLTRSRPWKDKFSADGYTAWRIDWRFNVTPSASGCRCSAFTTTTAITTTLPRWTGPTNAFQTIQPTWDRYFAALAEHEAGHARFALDAAAEMHKQVQALGEQPDCEGLKKKINALAQQVLADYRKREQQYDQTTRHGATQGAVFPGRPRGPRPWEEPRSR